MRLAGGDRRWRCSRRSRTRRTREDVPTRTSATVAPSRRPALRRAAHRSRRLHRLAFVLDRLGTRRVESSSSSRSNGSTTVRSRRSCMTTSSSATSSRSAARSVAGSCGTGRLRHYSSEADPVSCRSWRCCGTHAGPDWPTSCGSSSRCAHLTTCTTPTRSLDRRPHSCTRAQRRRRSRARPYGLRPMTSRSRLPTGLAAYICGSSGFADAASDVLIGVGVPPQAIRVERFGPSG